MMPLDELIVTFTQTEQIRHGGECTVRTREVPRYRVTEEAVGKLVVALCERAIPFDLGHATKRVSYEQEGLDREASGSTNRGNAVEVPYNTLFTGVRNMHLNGVTLQGKDALTIILENYAEAPPSRGRFDMDTVIGPGPVTYATVGMKGKIHIARPVDTDFQKVQIIRELIDEVYHPERAMLREKKK